MAGTPDKCLMMNVWVENHMDSILVAIEILWVAAFALVFVIYFVVRSRVKSGKISRSRDETASPPKKY